MSRIAALAALIILVACATDTAQRNAASADPVHIDDSAIGQSLDRIAYEGLWEHVAGLNDGRDAGTSTRSRHAGDNFTVPFEGTGIRIYGVRGPNGGYAAVAIDGTYYGTAGFYAPRKQVHALIFESPQLARGTHTLGVVVQRAQSASHAGYVNIDEIEVLLQQ